MKNSLPAAADKDQYVTGTWPLAFLIRPMTAVGALAGGCFSHWLSGFTLELIFSAMHFLAGLLMLFPVSERPNEPLPNRFGPWNLKLANDIYPVNLWIVVPVTLLSGFGSGMVGVSGGSFLVPLMVLACRVPMRIAVGTASTLIGATAFTGFIGHAIQGDFNPLWAVPLAAVTIVGGLLGGMFAVKTKPKSLKLLFAYTTILAALLMIVNACYSR